MALKRPSPQGRVHQIVRPTKKIVDNKLVTRGKENEIDNLLRKARIRRRLADSKQKEQKKVVDASIELTAEGLKELIVEGVTEALTALGFISKAVDPTASEDIPPVAIEEETLKEEPPVALEGEDKTDTKAEEEEEETETETDDDKEKGEDASDELAKILADPAKKAALTSLLKDAKSVSVTKKTADAATKFVSRYDVLDSEYQSTQGKSTDSSPRKSRYE